MPTISAFVIAYNRAELLRACLRRVRFVDELIVVDKSSTDETPEVARELADRYELVPWSPVVEDTRAYAQSLCTGDWIICLDDDEVLSPTAPEGIAEVIARCPEADVFYIPIRHYILGRFDPRAYPEELRPALYRRGMIEYPTAVHASAVVDQACRQQVKVEGIWIDHLSHPDVAAYLEKTNRYTSQPNRSGLFTTDPAQLAMFARHRIGLVAIGGDAHVEAVGLLRAVYDIIDVLKRWEETQPNGHEAFRQFCQAIEQEPR
jgi:glycosyltransferase involved in cell wall biosynthesis